MATAMRSGCGRDQDEQQAECAEGPRSMARRVGVRGPIRPAKSVTRLARKGRAASPRDPSSRVPHAEPPMVAARRRRPSWPRPAADDRSSARLRCRRGGEGSGSGDAGDGQLEAKPTRHLDQSHGLACEVSCRARLLLRPARTFRDSPQGGCPRRVPPSSANGGSATSKVARRNVFCEATQGEDSIMLARRARRWRLCGTAKMWSNIWTAPAGRDSSVGRARD